MLPRDRTAGCRPPAPSAAAAATGLLNPRLNHLHSGLQSLSSSSLTPHPPRADRRHRSAQHVPGSSSRRSRVSHPRTRGRRRSAAQRDIRCRARPDLRRWALHSPSGHGSRQVFKGQFQLLLDLRARSFPMTLPKARLLQLCDPQAEGLNQLVVTAMSARSGIFRLQSRNHRLNMAGSSGSFCGYIRQHMATTMHVIAPIKTKRFKPIIFSHASGRRRPNPALRLFNAFPQHCKLRGRSTGAPPRSLQPRESGRVPGLYNIEAKATDRPNKLQEA